MRKIKIILVGSRYTGKGQIGRSWGRTEADLPTIQPVLLYERKVEYEDKEFIVVFWVVSYESEFKELRPALYKKTDGIIYTVNLSDESGKSLKDLEEFRKELLKEFLNLPPRIIIGVKLDENEVSENIRNKTRDWAKEKGIHKYLEVDYTKLENFNKIIEYATNLLIERILSIDPIEEKESENDKKTDVS